MRSQIQSSENKNDNHRPPGLSPTNKQERNITLDVIRGIAILLVMFSHSLNVSKDAAPYFPPRLFVKMMQIGGWCGVDLFFVLSGFLVSGLLFNEFKKTQKIQPGKFLIRRGFKIYPGLAFFILFTFIIEKALSLQADQVYYPSVAYLKDLLFLHNYFGGRWEITWSLDIEEAFYFLLTAFFLLIISLKKMKLKTLVTTYIILVIIGITGRLITNLTHPEYDFIKHYAYSHFRLDGLFAGVLLAYFYHFEHTRLNTFITRYQLLFITIPVILLIPNFLFERDEHQWISIFLLATNPICFGFLLLVLLETKRTFFKIKVMAFIGRNSYPMYLWHLFINAYLIQHFYPINSIAVFSTYTAIYFGSTILTGILITRLIEIPFLNMRDRFYPAKSI